MLDYNHALPTETQSTLNLCLHCNTEFKRIDLLGSIAVTAAEFRTTDAFKTPHTALLSDETTWSTLIG